MRIGIDARKIGDFGIGTYIRGLLRGLVALERGDEYVAFAAEGTELPPGIEHFVADAPHYSLREPAVLGRAARRAGVELFHAPHYVTPVTRLPLVVTIHDLIHLHQPMRNPVARLYARLMIGRAIRNASVVLTVSETVRLQLESELGARAVVVTPNGIDPAPEGPACEKRHLLFVGNDKPHKNVDALVEAFLARRSRLAGTTLVLAGAAFRRFAHHEGVEPKGFVTGSQLADLYRGAFAVVLPSLEEGFGLPAAEAMALGTAVITSTAPALVEITGGAAMHVDAGDVHALGEALEVMVRDEALRRSFESRGVERARHFTWRRCAELTHDAYRRALSGG